jgi:hypothetical protein
MSNSPRYVGFIDPPYKVTLTDDSGAALNLTGCTGNSFTLTLLNVNDGTSKQGTGVWTTPADATGVASYQYSSADLAVAGMWAHYTTVKLPAEPSPREFDPELVQILAGTVGAGAAPPGVLPAPIAKALYFNVVDYAAVGDGTTDSTTMIAAARSAANTAGGGTVLYPFGTYLTGNQTLYNNVIDDLGGSTIKLKNGANTDLFSAYTSSINLSAAGGSGSNTGVTFFGIRNGILDGNKANQSSGTSYPLRFYGYGHLLEHVEIKNGYTGGVLMDWNGSANPTPPANAFMPRWYDVMVHDCNGICIQAGGPTDMQWTTVNAFDSGSHLVHLAPNGGALRMVNCHLWAAPIGVNAVSLLSEATAIVAVNCQFEGSDVCSVVLLANDNQLTGVEIGTAPPLTRDGKGIQLGQTAGNTPYPGQIFQAAGVTTAAASSVNVISGKILNCEDGAVDFQNEGHNLLTLNIYQTGGTGLASNRQPAPTDNIWWNLSGLATDHTLNTDNQLQISGGSNQAFRVITLAGIDLFNFDLHNSLMELVNGALFQGFSDNYGTPQFAIHAYNGNAEFNGRVQIGGASGIYSGSGAPSNSNGNNGDYYFRADTPGTANQRIYVKSAGSWVGIV